MKNKTVSNKPIFSEDQKFCFMFGEWFCTTSEVGLLKFVDSEKLEVV
jgi:hypothetical protein